MVVILGAPGLGPASADVGTAVRIQSDAASGKAPFDVRFKLLARTFPAGKIARVEVDPGDGSGVITAHTGRGWVRQSPKHTYRAPGRFTARIRLITTDGQEVVSHTRVTVRPEKEAVPTELLRAAPLKGDAPHKVEFTIGGVTLPFEPTAARISFGDGTKTAVKAKSTVSHTYQKPGRYRVRLEFRGRNGNRARAQIHVTVEEKPRLKFVVSPTSGRAPLEVTVRANIPRGDIGRARVAQDGKTIMSKDQIVGQAEGRTKITFTEPGTHEFRIQAETRSGQRLQEIVKVTVREAELAEGPTFFDHNGGVVQIVQQGGAFEGIMRAPTPAQAADGYDIGMVMVRGAFAERTYTRMRPLNYDDPNSPRRRYYEDRAVQSAGGKYLVLKGECEPQWADYTFNLDFGSDEDPARIAGDVLFKGHVTYAERAYQRLGQPMPRRGIVGHINWVDQMMRVIASTRRGDEKTGGPNECAEGDEVDQTMPAAFRRITPKEARAQAFKNLDAMRDFAEHAYDGILKPPPADGTPRHTDPIYGDTPSSEDPVLLATGEFYETSVDLASPDAFGIGWRFQRTYRSQSGDRTSLGFGWVHNYQLALVREGTGWRYRDENGAQHLFLPFKDRPDLFEAPNGSRLLIDGDSRRLRTTDGFIQEFRPLLEEPERSVLQTITAPSGAALTFDYDLLGRLISVTDPADRVARYRYDGYWGYLQEVVAPNGASVRFGMNRGNLAWVARIDPATGEEYTRTSFQYHFWSESMPGALRGNLSRITLPRGSDGAGGEIRIQYGSDVNQLSFDRVVRQQTGALQETFAYARGGADGTEFVTSYQAGNRAAEEHRFAQDGRLLSTTYLLDEATRLTTRLLYDAEGRPAGRVFADGSELRIAEGPGPDQRTLSLLPAADAPGFARPLHWVIEREPVFGQDRAVWGPFDGEAPRNEEELQFGDHRERIFDYEEGGLTPELLAFGFAARAEPLGDVNGDGRIGDATGSVLVETDRANGGEASVVYTRGAWGEVESLQLTDGTLRRFTHDAAGAVTSVKDTDPRGVTRERAVYDWDENGALIGFSEDGSAFIGITRDKMGRIATVVSSLGDTRHFVYDAGNRIVAETDSAGQPVFTYAYDAFGNLLSRKRFPEPGVTLEEVLDHDAFGNVIAVTDAAGRWAREIDRLGRTIREVFPDETEAVFAYDSMGRVTEESWPGLSLSHSYDGLGRSFRTTRDDGSIYEVTAAGGMAERIIYDPDGAVVEAVRFEPESGYGPARLYSDFAPAGTVLTAPGGRAYTQPLPPSLMPELSETDRLGRLTGLTMQDGSQWEIAWDALGDPAQIIRDGLELTAIEPSEEPGATDVRLYGFAETRHVETPDGETVTGPDGRARHYGFDPYGRLVTEGDPGEGVVPEVEFSYDPAGRLIAHRNGETGWERVVDDVFPVWEALTLPDMSPLAITRGFDDEMRLERRMLPSGTEIAFSYPSETEVSATIGDTDLTLTYSDTGALLSVSAGGRTIDYRHPDPWARETGFSVAERDGAVLGILMFKDGVVTSMDGRAVTRDDAGRVIAIADSETTGAETYRYSETGGRLPESGDAPLLPAHASEAHGAELDALGHVQALSDLTLTRDGAGRVIGATKDGVETTYVRDALGRVVQVARDGTPEVTILYDGGAITGLYHADGTYTEYVLSPEGVPVVRVTADGLALLALGHGGGIVAALPFDGGAERFARTPFGLPLSETSGVGPGLHGMLFDPVTGLYLTSGRAMLARIGQFLSPEPLGPLHGPHPYLYALGDPLTYRDPRGATPFVGVPDTSAAKPDGPLGKLRKAPKRALDKMGKTIDDKVTRRMQGRDTSDSASGRPGGARDSGGSSGKRSKGDPIGSVGNPPPGTGVAAPSRRNSETLEEMREKRAEAAADLARREAERRAREAAFKRNTRFAKTLLPKNVKKLWLAENETFQGSFAFLERDDPPPWGSPAKGPVSGSPGDPHALLRSVLTGDDKLGGRAGDRLRFIFRDRLRQPLPVPPPAEQTRSPEVKRPKAPGGIGGRLFPGGGQGGGESARQPDTDPPTPAPRPGTKRKPGGMAGGVFR